jgi:UDP-N-acetylmuramate dehydrogenase
MIEIKENVSLAEQSTFRIGGPASYFTVVKNETEVKEALAWAKEKNVAYRVIGGGSNLLFSDAGYQGLIVKYFGAELSINNDEVELSAGTPLALAVNKTLSANLGGLEWAIGIPGTVGGAVVNNAGAYGGEISQNVLSVKIIQEGIVKEVSNNDCEFVYRSSKFKGVSDQGIILSVKLKLEKLADNELSQRKIILEKNLTDRLSKAPEGGSVGSTFRNIVLSEIEIKEFKNKFPDFPEQFVDYRKVPSAWLIESVGLKGRKIGGAMVSENHAGKITNVGGATAEDIVMLVSVVKQKVRSKFSLQLMEEFEYIGF